MNMMNCLQFLGLFLPVLGLLYIYGKSLKECNNGKGNEPASSIETVILLTSIFILGFTLGTIVMKESICGG